VGQARELFVPLLAESAGHAQSEPDAGEQQRRQQQRQGDAQQAYDPPDPSAGEWHDSTGVAAGEWDYDKWVDEAVRHGGREKVKPTRISGKKAPNVRGQNDHVYVHDQKPCTSLPTIYCHMLIMRNFPPTSQAIDDPEPWARSQPPGVTRSRVTPDQTVEQPIWGEAGHRRGTSLSSDLNKRPRGRSRYTFALTADAAYPCVRAPASLELQGEQEHASEPCVAWTSDDGVHGLIESLVLLAYPCQTEVVHLAAHKVRQRRRKRLYPWSTTPYLSRSNEG
jgi:hypothetical protein